MRRREGWRERGRKGVSEEERGRVGEEGRDEGWGRVGGRVGG